MALERTTFAPSGTVIWVSAACCAGMGVAGMFSPLALTLVIGVLASFMGLGWIRMMGLPPTPGCRSTFVLGAILTAAAAFFTGVGDWPSGLVGAAAAVMLINFIQQIFRSDGRPRLAVTMALSTFVIAVQAAGATLIPLGAAAVPGTLVIVTLAGAAASTLADFAGRWEEARLWILPLGMSLAAVASGLAGGQVGIDAGSSMLLGVCAAITGHPVRWILAQAPRAQLMPSMLVTGIAGALSAGALPLVAAQLVILN